MRIRTWQALLFLSGISFMVTFSAVPSDDWFTSAAVSLSAGVTAFSMMAAAALLGGRWKIVESLFGGLDRVYQTHKWLGIFALAFASYHLVFKAGMKEWDTASIIALPPYYTRLVRQMSFVALMLIILLALNRNIPYHVWRWWHKLSGPLFLIVILHWLSFETPIALGSAAGIWLATVATLGVAAAAYKLLLYPFLSNHAEYRVVAATPGEAAMHLEMEPVKHAIAFEAGQFAFLSMKQDGLREPHPFTIASSDDPTGHVHFAIRSLGDYTQKLIREIKVGMYANVYAPYGRFRRRETSNREIWIGGGVGISPFISWLADESAGMFDKVTLFYFFTPGREFPSAEVLSDLARKRGAEFVPVATSVRSPEFSQQFDAIVQSGGPVNVEISFCGPKGLLKQVRVLMREHGVPQANLRYEYFDFR